MTLLIRLRQSTAACRGHDWHLSGMFITSWSAVSCIVQPHMPQPSKLRTSHAVPPWHLQVGGDQPQAHVRVIPASTLEFVLTDGKDSWDKPSLLYGKSSNYLVGGPGKYVVRGSKLEQQ